VGIDEEAREKAAKELAAERGGQPGCKGSGQDIKLLKDVEYVPKLEDKCDEKPFNPFKAGCDPILEEVKC